MAASSWREPGEAEAADLTLGSLDAEQVIVELAEQEGTTLKNKENNIRFIQLG